ncbi:potassium channel family protein [Paludibacterium yongneupense]|uniref:potassium channel family protein n=1 Tax=Paludibacterium yongneupense TaxID=400061 RepID=UPI000560C86C|nr:potassium channel family protein [Paludibacterium yongneupense]
MNTKRTFSRKLFWLLGGLLILVISGTLGYMLIEGWGWFDSLFMTIITLSTIGYGETHPLSPAGRAFTIVLIVFGTGGAGYGLSSLTLLLFQGDLPNYMKRRKMEKIIGRMSNHIVLCGLSRTGLYALHELEHSGQQLVVIERDESSCISRLGESDLPYINGDATSDENLMAAGVERARAIITCLTSDAENAFVVVTAKSLNPKIMAISKAESESTRKKLLAVGTDRVVVPSRLGGMSLAGHVIRPETLNFFEHLHSHYQDTFRAELHHVAAAWEGRTLNEYVADLGNPLMVIALEHPGGEVEFNPAEDAVLHAGSAIMSISNFQ